MQNWFSAGGGHSGGDNNHNSLPKALSSSSSSLLADWNSYAATKGSDGGGSSSLVGSFDIESAVRSANDTVAGTFNVVSRGVSNIPGNLQSATSNIPSGKSLMYFGLFLASGVFFIFMAFTLFLPVIVIVPQKFALCFTVGCGFIIGAFFMLKGPKNQFLHMTSTERLPFTVGFIGSMVGTIYVSMVLHSYILSVFFAVIQVLALAYYCISYFPGGSAGMKFLTSSMTSAVLKCFGRLLGVAVAWGSTLPSWCDIYHPFARHAEFEAPSGCQYGEHCKFLHANQQQQPQQQQAKPNPFGFGTAATSSNPQPQKPSSNPFGFGVQNNSQTGSKPNNQFKPGENKWSRFSPINTSSAPQKQQDNQASAPNHVCTDSESCKRQISEDYEHEKPLWKLTCYAHCKYGPCDIIGDISYEELRASSYDDAKRGMNIQSIVEKERSLISSKLIEFENLLRNPYTPRQNSTLSTQNTFSGTTPQMIQNNNPPLVSSFSQLGTAFNSGFQMRPAAPNSVFGQVNQFQPPSQISNAPQKNPFAFGNPGALGSQASTKSFVSSFPATTTTFGNAFSTATTSPPNLDVPRQQSSMPFGGQNPSANAVPESSSAQIMQNVQNSSSNVDNSIWFKEEWRPGEIPEEAPPEGVIY